MKKSTDRQQLWAVLIGIDSYHDSLGKLKYAGKDCRDLKQVLLSQRFGFKEDHILLLDESQSASYHPTYGNIHRWLKSWLKQLDENDLVLFYFAGHGLEVDSKCYLALSDSTLSMPETMIPLNTIQDALQECNARDKVLIVEACHSGSGRDVALMREPMQQAFAMPNDIFTITSCGVDQRSYEWEEKQRGVFSYYLTEAFKRGCELNREGRLSLKNVFEYVSNHVVSWGSNRAFEQSPQCFSNCRTDISLAVHGAFIEPPSIVNTPKSTATPKPPVIEPLHPATRNSSRKSGRLALLTFFVAMFLCTAIGFGVYRSRTELGSMVSQQTPVVLSYVARLCLGHADPEVTTSRNSALPPATPADDVALPEDATLPEDVIVEPQANDPAQISDVEQLEQQASGYIESGKVPNVHDVITEVEELITEPSAEIMPPKPDPILIPLSPVITLVTPNETGPAHETELPSTPAIPRQLPSVIPSPIDPAPVKESEPVEPKAEPEVTPEAASKTEPETETETEVVKAKTLEDTLRVQKISEIRIYSKSPIEMDFELMTTQAKLGPKLVESCQESLPDVDFSLGNIQSSSQGKAGSGVASLEYQLKKSNMPNGPPTVHVVITYQGRELWSDEWPDVDLEE